MSHSQAVTLPVAAIEASFVLSDTRETSKAPLLLSYDSLISPIVIAFDALTLLAFTFPVRFPENPLEALTVPGKLVFPFASRR